MSLFESIKNGQLREQIETAFGAWGRTVFHHRWGIIIFVAILCSGLFSQLSHIKFDGTFTGFFYKGDPALQIYDHFREQYGRDDNVIILLKTDEVFNLAFLNQLKALHEKLKQETPYLDDIDSLINARQTIGVKDTLIVQDFLKQWPENDQDLAKLKAEAMANPDYIGTFLSANGKYTAIHIKNQGYIYNQTEALDDLTAGFDESNKEVAGEKRVLNHEEESEIKKAIDKVISEANLGDVNVFIAGGPYSTAALVDIYAHGMMKYTGLSIVLIGFLLLLIYRRIAMVFLPLIVAFLAMLSALAPMAILNIPVSFSMQIVPSFLIAVGVGNSVHVCTIYYQAIDRGFTKIEAIAHSLQHSGLAILMTGLTTAGGLLSFLSSGMKPIAEFGTITPVGVLFALFFSLALLPALLAIIPVKPRKNSSNKTPQPSLIEKSVVWIGDYSVRNPIKVISIWAICIVIALFGAFQIKFSFWVLKQLPPDHEVVIAIQEIDANFSGIVPLEFIIDSGKANGVKDPAFLKKLDAINELVKNFIYEGNTFIRAISIVNINKELHQALNQNNKGFYIVPDDPLLISQELLLFENSGADDLEQVVDSQFRYARLSIASNNADAVKFKPMLDAFLVEFNKIFNGYHYQKTGVLDLTVSIFNEMYVSMAKSYVIAFLVITPLMILLIGSIRLGLLCMIPNLAPIILTLGMMGITGIDLTTATLLVGSIAMGLVVDDTIHFMHNFQRYFARGNNVADSVRKTLSSAGLAIVFTSMVLSAAFMVFTFNTMLEWVYFGVVASFCIVAALFADITLSPALLAVLHQKTAQKQEP